MYKYDFGDGGWHELVVAKALSSESGVHSPRSWVGMCACPPED
ncbi:MAG: IS1096 element passenger TnpR family protein [Gammaproteobacteria bacterium]